MKPYGAAPKSQAKTWCACCYTPRGAKKARERQAALAVEREATLVAVDPDPECGYDCAYCSHGTCAACFPQLLISPPLTYRLAEAA